MKKNNNILNSRWTAEILMEFHKNKTNCRRYSDFKKNIRGITPRILSIRLKELSDAKIIVKKIDAASFPVKCEYHLAKPGKDFMKIAALMDRWEKKWR